MKSGKREFSESMIRGQTILAWSMRRDVFSRAKKLKEDKQKSLRLANQECATCFYIPRIAGQAITDYQCSRCAARDSWGNTSVPWLCVPCAQELNLCRRCAADIDLNLERKE